MQPHCVFLYRRIVDPSGYFFSERRLESKGVMFHDG